MQTNMRFFHYIAPIMLIVLSALGLSCKNQDNQSFKIARFDLDLSEYNTLNKTQKEEFIKEYTPVIQNYILRIDPDTSLSINDKLEHFANSNTTKFFEADIKERFVRTDSIEKILGQANASIRRLLGFGLPHLYGAVIPYNQSIIITDSMAIIGLNHYLGVDYRAYSDFPEFIRRRKTPERLPYDIVEATLKTRYPLITATGTTLEQMLYEGAIAYATSKIIPDFDEARCFDMTSEQLKWVEDNEPQIWRSLVNADLLDDTSIIVKQTLFNPAPFAAALSKEVPAETGRWIGLRIISKYLESNKISIKDFLQQRSYHKSKNILISIAYNGQ